MRFSEALNRRAEEIQRPSNLPLGHYILSVKKVDQSTVSDGKWEVVEFQTTVVSASDDVDPDQLEEFGKVAGEPLRKRFMFPTDPAEARSFELSMVNLKRMLVNLNIGFTDDGDMTLGEALASAVGAQFLGECIHRPDKQNPENIYTEIGKTAPLI